jgi:aspartyl-tRNA(Asn)/glutamyl-tRNA(Gln) amidotransferase subunit A
VLDPYNAFVVRTAKKRGDGPLSGLRFSIKENMDLSGFETTACSKILKGNVAGTDAEIVSLLLHSGAEIVGKTNMHEFALGATNTSSIFGPVRNPVDTERISGGSSGGAAASVAASLCDIALGTDTGGSVRLPAALCGVSGFKPTYGVLITEGIVPLSRSLDTVGLIARNAATILHCFSVLSGIEIEAVERPVTRAACTLFDDGEVSRSIFEVLRAMDGLSLVRKEIPWLERAAEARKIVRGVEGFRYHEKWLQQRPEDYFPDVRKALLDGVKLEGMYEDALNDLVEMAESLTEFMKDYDVLITPACYETAPKISEVLGREVEYRRLLNITEVFNSTRSPSISLPVTRVRGLPVSALLNAPPDEDMRLLAVAVEMEKRVVQRGG